MPKESMGYVLDRIVGVCENCGSTKETRIVWIFKDGKKNFRNDKWNKRGYEHRMKPRMYCKNCISNGVIREHLQEGESCNVVIWNMKDESPEEIYSIVD